MNDIKHSVKVIHIKRQKLLKIKTREWSKTEERHRYISRTNLEKVILNITEVKYSKTVLNIIVYQNKHFYSDTFNEYYRTLSNKSKKELETNMSFNDFSLTIIEPFALYFISDWGKIKVIDNV